MAKIPSFKQNIFGENAGGSQISVFGSLFAGAAAFTTNAAAAQALSNWLDGWLSAVIGGNSPAIEDMNAVFFVITTQLAYLKQSGINEWDAETEYYTGSIVNVEGHVYVSLLDNNIANPVDNFSAWKRYGSNLTQFNGSGTVLVTDDMVEHDATVASCTSTLPAAGDQFATGKKITITKTDSSTNTVTVTDGVYSQALMVQYDSVTMFSNGTVWYAI